jgi:hypothetical protein
MRLPNQSFVGNDNTIEAGQGQTGAAPDTAAPWRRSTGGGGDGHRSGPSPLRLPRACSSEVDPAHVKKANLARREPSPFKRKRLSGSMLGLVVPGKLQPPFPRASGRRVPREVDIECPEDCQNVQIDGIFGVRSPD